MEIRKPKIVKVYVDKSKENNLELPKEEITKYNQELPIITVEGHELENLTMEMLDLDKDINYKVNKIKEKVEDIKKKAEDIKKKAEDIIKEKAEDIIKEKADEIKKKAEEIYKEKEEEMKKMEEIINKNSCCFPLFIKN
jgi:vacuolar-type H+-ATPase subunit H